MPALSPGIGINAHSMQIPSDALVGIFSWVRVEFPLAFFDWAYTVETIDYYHDLGLEILFIVGQDWGDDAYGYARDIAQRCGSKITAFELYNEPQLDDTGSWPGMSASDYVNVCAGFARLFYRLPVFRYGGSVFNYHDSNAVGWMNDAKAAGLENYCDGISWHHYADTVPETIAVRLVELQVMFPAKPIACTETSWPKSFLTGSCGVGVWSETVQGQFHVRQLAVRGAMPVCLYDGNHNSVQVDAGQALINTLNNVSTDPHIRPSLQVIVDAIGTGQLVAVGPQPG